ncbi:MAG: hypothetical protein ACRDRW_04050 [Pseudonocardiaceae bacterium]
MYEVVTDDEVAQQVAALPDELLPYYAQVLDVLELAPWNGEPYNNAKPDGVMRKLLFGPGGQAEAIYLVLEHDHRVELLRVHWVS